MKDFAAIDFETANNERSSVCSVGIVIVRNGEIVDKFYSLIKPEPEYYTYWCSRVHGLSAADTQDAPVFPEVWKQIEPKIAGLPLVAHNKAFDESCLKAVFRVYQMTYPSYPFFCTCGVGFDAFVSLQFSKAGRRGPLTYLEKTLLESLKYRPETRSEEHTSELQSH